MAKAKPHKRRVERGRKQDAIRSNLRRLRPYLVRAGVVVVALFALSRALPSLPTWTVAVALAVLSLVPATGSVYRIVVNRTFDQGKYGEGSIHKGAFRLRIGYFIGFYVLSAISVASILVESPTWGVGMWATVVLAVPLYVAVAAVAGWFVEKKEKAIPLVRDARAARFSVIATGVLLCMVFTAISFLQPAEAYTRAADAFMAAPKPFENSPSALMRELGDLTALVGGLQSYALAKLSERSWHIYLIVQVFLNAAAMLGVTGMLSVCFVEPRELKRVFLVLEKGGERGERGGHGERGECGERGGRGRHGERGGCGGHGERGDIRPPVKSFCVVFVLLPLLLAGCVVGVDKAVQDPSQERLYQFAKKIVRDQVSLFVYELDGKYYDPEAVDEILANARRESEALAREAEATLVPLVNASFDARIANVDRYLDWYYGLFTDWEVMFNTMSEKTAEDYMKEQMIARIEEGVDDSVFNDAVKRYLEQCEDLKADTRSKLARYELATEYPAWLVEEAKPLDDQVAVSLQLTEDFVDSCYRLGINKTINMTEWPTLNGLVNLGVGVITRKVDELQNREDFKNKLVSAIEEQREKTLEAVRSMVDASASV